jgi:hypothetical protein
MRDADAPEPLLPKDAGLGIPVEVTAAGQPRHPLVTVGDSIAMGFKSLAITDTSLSWPALLAQALQLNPDAFTYPTYPGPGDCRACRSTSRRWSEASTLPRPSTGAESTATMIDAARHRRRRWHRHARGRPRLQQRPTQRGPAAPGLVRHGRPADRVDTGLPSQPIWPACAMRSPPSTRATSSGPRCRT